MRIFVSLSVGILIIAIAMGCASNESEEIARLKEENEALKALVGPPPSSLDNLYPPKAEGPVFLMSMFGMATPFVGITVDMFEKDVENAKANFERFKKQYVEISKLVPEWEMAYPMEPVEELGLALGTDDQGKVKAAFEKVGKVCHDCHIVNMPKVQYKYHWGDFSELSVTDPVTKDEVDFNQFMHYIDVSFVGIGVDLVQGQVENALKHFEAFNQRFQSMKETCEACHETEREYYVDESVQGMVDKLGAVLRSATPDPKAVEELSMGIGMENCRKCHWVHEPAALAKSRWEESEKIEGKE